MEFLVQPADRAVLPRDYGQRVSLPRVRRTAGERIRRCEQSRRRRAITFRDWQPVGAEEYGYVAPDPLDPDIVYGGKSHALTDGPDRCRTSRQRSYAAARTESSGPIRSCSRRLIPCSLFRSNVVLKTRDGGMNWTVISSGSLAGRPGKHRTTSAMYRNTETARATARGVIYTVAPSPIDGITHLGRN